jgi:hypothetical protein
LDVVNWLILRRLVVFGYFLAKSLERNLVCYELNVVFRVLDRAAFLPRLYELWRQVLREADVFRLEVFLAK